MAVAKLTDRLIRNLKTEQRQEDFYDEGFSGGSFLVRVTCHGRKTFVLRYRAGGRKRRMTLGVYPSTTLADARAKARREMAEVFSGGDPAALRRDKSTQGLTFKELSDLYIERHARVNKKASSVREDERILKTYLLPAWRSRKAAEITRREVMRLLDSIAFGRREAPVMANRVKALAHTVYNFGIKKSYLPDESSNPCAAIEPLVKETSRDRVLSHKEIEKLWEELDARKESTASLYRLILLTAQRPGEVKRMRWDTVQGELWVIPATIVKNGREHRVPLSPQAMAILEPLKEDSGDSEWVFPSRTGGHVRWLQKTSQRLHEKLKFTFRPHDLRRTAATGMGELGVDEMVIARVLNHRWADGHITAVYNRYKHLPEMRAALEAWGAKLEEITKADAAIPARSD